jgi:tRNA (guanine-N7-)-methyltransferase
MACEAPDAAKRRTLYGRSKGKRLSGHRERLVAELLPRLAVDRDALAEPAKLFAFAPDEIRLEIGFGGGEHLAECAAEAPGVGFIGCEPFLNGVAKLLAAIEAGGLDNIRVHMGDARALVAALSPASLSRIYLLYPDPWPKRRHTKRRIVSNDTVALLARVIKRGGEVRFATDIDDYAGWTLRRFAVSSDYRWRAARADDWRKPWPGWRATRYEAKARAAGRASAYLTFERV